MSKKQLSKIYDYVIVGAGSAGCLIANRLSKNLETSVLLIEAGEDYESLENTIKIGIPALTIKNQQTKLDYAYKTNPYESAYGLFNNISLWPRGKVLGGSSALNYMAWVLGHKNDYISWDSANFNFETIHNSFKKIENTSYINSDLLPNKEERGKEGDILISIREDTEVKKMWASVLSANGVANKDFNTPYDHDQIYYHGQYNIHNGIRQYKFIWDGKAISGLKTTDGVEINARNIIVSSGAVDSPALLQRSGIGEKILLDKHAIETKIDNSSVGQNLQDHLMFIFNFNFKDTSSSKGTARPGVDKKIFDITKEFIKRSMGSDSVLNYSGLDMMYFMKSNESLDTPDIQIHFCSMKYTPEMIEQYINLKVISEDFKNSLQYDKPGWMGVVTLLHPKSKGYVKISSADPSIAPEIEANYHSHPDDLKSLRAGVRRLLTFFENGFETHNDMVQHTPSGEVMDHERMKTDDAYLDGLVKGHAVTIYHPMGTCAIGEVVDDDLKLKGVENVYVCDASVFKSMPSGNTNAPVIALAQRFTEVLLSNEKDQKVRSKKHVSAKL